MPIPSASHPAALRERVLKTAQGTPERISIVRTVLRSLRDELHERGWRPSADAATTTCDVSTHVQNEDGSELYAGLPGAAADGLVRTPLETMGMGAESQRHERKGAGHEEPYPRQPDPTPYVRNYRPRERLVDGRWRKTSGPYVTSTSRNQSDTHRKTQTAYLCRRRRNPDK